VKSAGVAEAAQRGGARGAQSARRGQGFGRK
jgi:hypothetical protein